MFFCLLLVGFIRSILGEVSEMIWIRLHGVIVLSLYRIEKHPWTTWSE